MYISLLKKHVQQKGRSMVEMLGVLAIIAVLSIGGIKGYSLAMSKYNLNKTLEQVVIIFNNLIEHHNNNKDFTLNNTVINSLNILPKEMGTAQNCHHALGGKCYLMRGETSHKVLIRLHDLSAQNCVEIVTYFQNSVSGITPCASSSNSGSCENSGFISEDKRTGMTLNEITEMCKGKKNSVFLYLGNLL